MIRCALLLSLLAGPVAALELSLPAGARLIADRASVLDSYALPVGGWQDGAVPLRIIEGRVDRRSWRIDSGGLTTLQLLAPLRAQVQQAGFEVIHECEARECGGFDFRFGIEVIPAPDMHVDVRDFRFLSAAAPDGQAVSLLVSRSRSAGYVQVFVVTLPQARPPALRPGTAQGAPPSEPVTPPVTVAGTGGFAENLLADGHIVLDGLEFATGADSLADRPYPALEALAAFLRANPDLRIGLVGHTDAVGALDVNIDLSRRRAQAVRQRLIDRHDMDPARMDAEGMGYLSPAQSNLSPAGREANRRVEAILLPPA